jgi:hypothetical protein
MVMVVVVIAGGQVSRASKRVKRDAICWVRSANTLAMGSGDGGTFGC